MKLVRFIEGSRPVAGLVEEDKVKIYERLGSDPFGNYISQIHPEDMTFEEFIQTRIRNDRPRTYNLEWVESRFIMPMVPSEVWIAGVTYKRSMDAREEETGIKGIYDMVYESERPELTFKGLGYRTVGPNDVICIRSDATWNVPEPELTLVYADKSIVGYMIGNDVSSRDIEGENPLYLPQAKIWQNSCAIGPYLTTKDDLKNPKNVEINLTIYRSGEIVFKGNTNTSNMKRSLDVLTEYLFRDNPIPRGSILLTGVGVVPSDDVTLQDGDVVEIEMDGLGKMTNNVCQL